MTKYVTYDSTAKKYSVTDINNVLKSGDTMTGVLIINTSEPPVRFSKNNVEYGHVGISTDAKPILSIGSSLFTPSFIAFRDGSVDAGTTFNAPRINITDSVIHIRGASEYSAVRTYNTAGQHVRWESYPSTSTHAAAISTFDTNKTTVVGQSFFPKKVGTVAHISDIPASFQSTLVWSGATTATLTVNVNRQDGLMTVMARNRERDMWFTVAISDCNETYIGITEYGGQNADRDYSTVCRLTRSGTNITFHASGLQIKRVFV